MDIRGGPLTSVSRLESEIHERLTDRIVADGPPFPRLASQSETPRSAVEIDKMHPLRVYQWVSVPRTTSLDPSKDVLGEAQTPQKCNLELSGI